MDGGPGEWVTPVSPKAAHEGHRWTKSCLSDVDLQEPMQKLMNCGIKASQLRASRAAFSIRPDIDTHGTFSACRPIVGVGDQYDVGRWC